MKGKFEEDILIPEKRIKQLLKYKSRLEELGNIKLEVDKLNNLVKIKSDEAVNSWICEKVIKAIARGFILKDAEKLFNTETTYTQLDLKNFGAKNKKQQLRLKGRVIGTEGTSKKKIQDLTKTKISIYGKTIGIIGEQENVELAKKAIEMLLSGSKHSTAYRFIYDNLK